MYSTQISRSTKIILSVEFILLAYMFYVLSTSLYKSYQIDKFIKSAEDENAKMEHANSLLAEDYEYYKSDAYKEKIIKQNLGLIRPGEEVIVLTKDDKVAFLTPEEQAVKLNKDRYQAMSNPKKWFIFFFDRDRFAM